MSVAQGWASECPDVKNYKWQFNLVWYRMLHSCTHMATVGVKGLILIILCSFICLTWHIFHRTISPLGGKIWCNLAISVANNYALWYSHITRHIAECHKVSALYSLFVYTHHSVFFVSVGVVWAVLWVSVIVCPF